MRRRLLAAAALLASWQMVVAGGPASAGPPAEAPRTALVIGIGRHSGNRPAGALGGAGDANAVREALRRAGWADDQVRVLIDGAATAANIRSGLQWLKERSGPNSFTFFHYSGHVFQRNGDPDRDGEDRDEFLVPYDARNVISDRELGERLGGVQGWLWTDLSGCEAMGFNEGGLAGPQRLFTASSAEHEKGYEQPDWKLSVYTGLWAEFAMNQGKGDANGDGYVSIQEAFRYAEAQAPVITKGQRKGTQHPQMAGGDGTEWFLRPPPPPPPPPSSGPGATGAKKLCLLPDLCI